MHALRPSFPARGTESIPHWGCLGLGMRLEYLICKAKVQCSLLHSAIVPQWCMQVEVSASPVCKLATELDMVLPGPQVSLVSVYNPTFRHCHCC